MPSPPPPAPSSPPPLSSPPTSTPAPLSPSPPLPTTPSLQLPLPSPPPSPALPPLPPGQQYVPGLQAAITFVLNETLEEFCHEAPSVGCHDTRFEASFRRLVGCNEPACRILLLDVDGNHATTVGRRLLAPGPTPLTVQVQLFHETNASNPVFLALDGLAQQSPAWLTVELGVPIVGVVGAQGATPASFPQAQPHKSSRAFADTAMVVSGLLVLVFLLSYLCLKLLPFRRRAVSMLRERHVRDQQLLALRQEELEEGRFDVFLSYRVRTDAELVEQLYYMLCAHGLRVWWDKKCLVDGQKWEEGFADGLFASTIFVPVLSKGALAPFGSLTSDSKADNVLLEYTLALEAMAQGSICRGIFPIMVGEIKQDSQLGELYVSFFDSGGMPDCPAIAVQRVADTAAAHLERAQMGEPRYGDATVKQVLNRILFHQGHQMVGIKQATTEQAVSRIVDAIRKPRSIQERRSSDDMRRDDSRTAKSNAPDVIVVRQVRRAPGPHFFTGAPPQNSPPRSVAPGQPSSSASERPQEDGGADHMTRDVRFHFSKRVGASPRGSSMKADSSNYSHI